MPLCMGAIDGNTLRYRHQNLAELNILATRRVLACDAFYRFTMVDIGQSGSNHDSEILKLSKFGQAVLDEALPFPDDLRLPGQVRVIPHYFAGDQAFPLHRRIMRPYAGKNLGKTRNIFNHRLSRARRNIENTFGILAQRWRILRKPIIADVRNCEKIIQAVVCLHNYLQTSELDIPVAERCYCPTGYSDYVDRNGEYHFGDWRKGKQNLTSIGRIGTNNSKRTFQLNRDTLADYFESPEGSVPWQHDYVLRGSLPTHN